MTIRLSLPTAALAVFAGIVLTPLAMGQAPLVTPFGRSFPGQVIRQPELRLTGVPLAGSPLGVEITGGQPAGLALVGVGLFASNPPALLPGAPLYFGANPNITPVPLDAGGRGLSGQVAVPPGSPLLGLDLNAQALLFDQMLPLGYQTTRGLRVRVGTPVPGPRYSRSRINTAVPGTYPILGALADTTALDLNGDGREDIVGRADDYGIAMSLLADSSGSFGALQQSPLFLPAPTHLPVLKAGLIDGDTIPDVIASDGQNTLIWAAGAGDGTFPLPTTVALPASRLEHLVTLDLTGDKRQEIAVVDNDSTTPGVWILDNDGAGNLSPRAMPLPLTAPVRSLETGDFNGDGLPDLLAFQLIAFQSPTLLVSLGGPAGILRPFLSVTVPDRIAQVAIADLDGDQADDVVAMTYPNSGTLQIQILYGNAAGAPPVISAPLYSLSGLSTRNGDLECVDLDGDGTLEIVFGVQSAGSNHIVSLERTAPRSWQTRFDRPEPLFPNQIVAPLSPLPVLGRSLLFGAGGSLIHLLPDGSGGLVDQRNLAVPNTSRIVHVGDFTGDDISDVLLALEPVNGGGTPSLQLVAGVGDGDLLPPQQIGTITELAYATGAADFDRDGDLDVLVIGDDGSGFATTRTFPNDGSGTFSNPVQQAAGLALDTRRTLRIGDMDLDGLPDLVVASRSQQGIVVLMNAGGLAFTPDPAVPYSPLSPWLEIADLDNDGYPDLIGPADTLQLPAPTEILVFRNLSGTSGPQRLAAPQPHNVGYYPGGITVGDVDRDGNQDVVTWAPTPTTRQPSVFAGLPKLLLGQGGGLLGPASTVSSDWIGKFGQLVDLDGDGSLELVGIFADRYGTGPEKKLYANMVRTLSLTNAMLPGFTGPQDTILRSTTEVSEAYVHLADMNRDGLLDIVATVRPSALGLQPTTMSLQVHLNQRGGRK